jgi:hypothetical protein
LADPVHLWPGRTTRAATFENPTARRSAGGTGRKEGANRLLEPDERVTLAAFDGPGTITHIWLTVGDPTPDAAPAFLRRQVLEVFYGGSEEPSVSVPMCDFFGAVHGVRAAYASALTAVNEGEGFSSRIPLPFTDGIRIDYENGTDTHALLYYQVDCLLGALPESTGILHATFRRENPTTQGRDFVIAEGLRGPGRFLGCTAGVRVQDSAHWWGEGEVKMYFDGESQPTICGTGTEDYLDSAWGLGPFAAPESGAPLVVASPEGHPRTCHRLVGFYRWHLSDPVVFEHDLRVTVQQLGMDLSGAGLFERSDDWSATAFTYCAEAQPVPRLDREVLTP